MTAPLPSRDDLSDARDAPSSPSPRFEVAALLIITTVAALLRLARLSGLAPDLGEATEFLNVSPDRFVVPRAWSAALGAAAPAVVWALLRSGTGPWIALATAAIAAMTPWAVHASRSGSTVGASFVASLALFAALRGQRLTLAVAIGAVAAGLSWWAASKTEPTSESIDAPAWLVSDVGLGSLVFVLAAGIAPSDRARVIVVAAGGALLPLALAFGFNATLCVAPLTACVIVLAGGGLGRWLAAADGSLLRSAALVLALLPSMPALVSEFIDGGRFDLVPLSTSFSAQHGSGEPLFASDPDFASHAFGVECRRLPLLATSPSDFLPADRPSWVLLLFDRGRALGDQSRITPVIERELALVARSSRKRFDLHRFEARLYRRATPRSPGP